MALHPYTSVNLSLTMNFHARSDLKVPDMYSSPELWKLQLGAEHFHIKGPCSGMLFRIPFESLYTYMHSQAFCNCTLYSYRLYPVHISKTNSVLCFLQKELLYICLSIGAPGHHLITGLQSEGPGVLFSFCCGKRDSQATFPTKNTDT